MGSGPPSIFYDSNSGLTEIKKLQGCSNSLGAIALLRHQNLCSAWSAASGRWACLLDRVSKDKKFFRVSGLRTGF